MPVFRGFSRGPFWCSAVAESVQADNQLPQ
jgi:hypothetical protein